MEIILACRMLTQILNLLKETTRSEYLWENIISRGNIMISGEITVKMVRFNFFVIMYCSIHIVTKITSYKCCNMHVASFYHNLSDWESRIKKIWKRLPKKYLKNTISAHIFLYFSVPMRGITYLLL